MKKIFTLVFILLMCVVVAACGGGDKKTVLKDGSYIIKASENGVDMEQYYDKDDNILKEITKKPDGTYREFQFDKDGILFDIVNLFYVEVR